MNIPDTRRKRQDLLGRGAIHIGFDQDGRLDAADEEPVPGRPLRRRAFFRSQLQYLGMKLFVAPDHLVRTLPGSPFLGPHAHTEQAVARTDEFRRLRLETQVLVIALARIVQHDHLADAFGLDVAFADQVDHPRLDRGHMREAEAGEHHHEDGDRGEADEDDALGAQCIQARADTLYDCRLRVVATSLASRGPISQESALHRRTIRSTT